MVGCSPCLSNSKRGSDQPDSKTRSRSSCWSWCSSSKPHEKVDEDYVRGGQASPSGQAPLTKGAAVQQSSFAAYANNPSAPPTKRRSQLNGFAADSTTLSRASAASSVDLERYHSARSHLSMDSVDLDARSPSDTFVRPSEPPVLEDSEYQPDSRVDDSAGSLDMRHSQASPKHGQPAPGSREEFLLKFDQGWLTFLKKCHGGNAQQACDVQMPPPAPWNRKPGFLVSSSHSTWYTGWIFWTFHLEREREHER